MTFGFFLLAALLEIAGCYAFWLWWKLDKSALWLFPGLLALAGFAWILAQVDSAYAGRAYAAYGGVYIASSLVWGAVVEKQLPSHMDLTGASLCLAGAAIIFFGSRV